MHSFEHISFSIAFFHCVFFSVYCQYITVSVATAALDAAVSAQKYLK